MFMGITRPEILALQIVRSIETIRVRTEWRYFKPVERDMGARIEFLAFELKRKSVKMFRIRNCSKEHSSRN
jgi:hypothetical protein